MFCCTIIVSCDTDEPPFPSQNNQDKNEGDSNSDSSNASNDNNASDDKYYFELEKPAAREIRTEAGAIQIFFKCNQEYTISTSGNITGLSLSHTFGKGDGSVTVSFDEVEYKDSGWNITWHETGYIIFTVKEGPKSNFKIVKNMYYLCRVGSKMKV